ncbi:hypothetical protein SAMN06265365_102400 [Tistlia consotensis]|uniref:DUF3108 domain-containing protein n=1 Tax=Tistlia consotensis USBA 355 TaxID=560819 RepID=A0A1Y6C6H3_9PROT|nr:DUF6134 family protein [Tistlia consotensis]SMF38738.1 hypothetical protein SAMN05428998_11363 [Tistlia consotensis USBA 355]SNR36887.1 hypothetical protein SAMN06265365_102400 [Tistlia consotensis]
MPSGSISRRALVAGLVSTPLLAAAPLPGGLSARAWAAPMPALQFDILRKGDTIGSHRVSAEKAADDLQIDIETEIKVRVLGLTAYRYRHQGRETWRREGDGIRLVGLETRTDDDGTKLSVEGEAEGGIFKVDGSAGPVTAPADVVPASYWSPLVLRRSELLSAKDGDLFPIRVEQRGRETIESAGQQVATQHAFIPGDPAVHLWFDDRQQIRRLAFETHGEFIDYRLRRIGPFGLDDRVF